MISDLFKEIKENQKPVYKAIKALKESSSPFLEDYSETDLYAKLKTNRPPLFYLKNSFLEPFYPSNNIRSYLTEGSLVLILDSKTGNQWHSQIYKNSNLFPFKKNSLSGIPNIGNSKDLTSLLHELNFATFTEQ